MQFNRLSDLIQQDKLRGKRVFIRADMNVPQDDAGNITEDTRIRASVPAIEAALAAGAAVMVTSHLGRPVEGEFKPEDTLAPIAKRLAELLGKLAELVRERFKLFAKVRVLAAEGKLEEALAKLVEAQGTSATEALESMASGDFDFDVTDEEAAAAEIFNRHVDRLVALGACMGDEGREWFDLADRLLAATHRPGWRVE